MEGEGKKLTSEQKGKEIMPAALNDAHAADLKERSSGVEIRGSTPSATQITESSVPTLRRSARRCSVATGMDSGGTPVSAQSLSSSRKRKHADVEPVQKKAPGTAHHLPQMEDGDDFRELSMKVSRSVVTVAAVKTSGKVETTEYGTGFIIVMSEQNYSLVFTCHPSKKNEVKKYFVHFEGDKGSTEAHVLESDGVKFIILIIQTDREYTPVDFSDHPLGPEFVFTIAATGSVKLNASARSGLLVGSLQTHRGNVLVPTYVASNFQFKRIKEVEKFFEVTCPVQDDIINLRTVDKKGVRASNTILSAPVFRSDGKVGGIIYAPGNWGDIKCGLHAKSVISHIQSMCGNKWQEGLKKAAHYWLGARY